MPNATISFASSNFGLNDSCDFLSIIPDMYLFDQIPMSEVVSSHK